MLSDNIIEELKKIDSHASVFPFTLTTPFLLDAPLLSDSSSFSALFESLPTLRK